MIIGQRNKYLLPMQIKRACIPIYIYIYIYPPHTHCTSILKIKQIAFKYSLMIY